MNNIKDYDNKIGQVRKGMEIIEEENLFKFKIGNIKTDRIILIIKKRYNYLEYDRG